MCHELLNITCPNCFRQFTTELRDEYQCPVCDHEWSVVEPVEPVEEEPPGIRCEGCGARIDPDYGKCLICE